MKMKKIKGGPKKKVNTTKQVPNKEGRLNEEKEKIKTQIQSLKKIIEDAEFALQLTKFGDTKYFDSNNNSGQELKRIGRVKNLRYILHYELCKLSGFYCTKYASYECVFCFDPEFSGKKSLFCVQFFTNDKKGKIGKSVMPAMDSMESIIAETPIEKLTGVIPFLRNCRRHVICFASRKDQFDKLREMTDRMKNIAVDTDMEFKLVTINLTDVYDKFAENMINMIVYLSYDNGRAKPHTIHVDWSLKKKPTDDIVKAMKSFVKNFKHSILPEALQEIIDKKHQIFSWKPTQRNVNSVNLKDYSDSEEESTTTEEMSRTNKRKRSTSATPRRNKSDVSEEEIEDSDSSLDDTRKKKSKKNPQKKLEDKKTKKPSPRKNSREQSDSESSAEDIENPDTRPILSEKTKPRKNARKKSNTPQKNIKSKKASLRKNFEEQSASEGSEEDISDQDTIPSDSGEMKPKKNVRSKLGTRSKNINSRKASLRENSQERSAPEGSEEDTGNQDPELSNKKEKRLSKNAEKKSITHTEKKIPKKSPPKQRLLNFKTIDKRVAQIKLAAPTSTPKPKPPSDDLRKNLMVSLELSPILEDRKGKNVTPVETKESSPQEKSPALKTKKVEKRQTMKKPPAKAKIPVTKPATKKKKK